MRLLVGLALILVSCATPPANPNERVFDFSGLTVRVASPPEWYFLEPGLLAPSLSVAGFDVVFALMRAISADSEVPCIVALNHAHGVSPAAAVPRGNLLRPYCDAVAHAGFPGELVGTREFGSVGACQFRQAGNPVPADGYLLSAQGQTFVLLSVCSPAGRAEAALSNVRFDD